MGSFPADCTRSHWPWKRQEKLNRPITREESLVGLKPLPPKSSRRSFSTVGAAGCEEHPPLSAFAVPAQGRLRTFRDARAVGQRPSDGCREVWPCRWAGHPGGSRSRRRGGAVSALDPGRGPVWEWRVRRVSELTGSSCSVGKTPYGSSPDAGGTFDEIQRFLNDCYSS